MKTYNNKKQKIVEVGKKVKISFVGTLESGEVFDYALPEEPFEFTVGKSNVMKSFEKELIGMRENETKEFTINKEQAYGDWDPKLVFEIEKDAFDNSNVVQGSYVMLKTPNNQSLPAKVVEINENTITLDLNPPLAGHDLHFKVKIEEIK